MVHSSYKDQEWFSWCGSHQNWRLSEVFFNIFESFLAGFIPYKRDTLFHKSGERLTMTWEICNESSDIGQPTLQTPKFLEILRWLHALNSFNLVRIKMNSFRCDNKSQKLATWNTQERFCWVHFQLMGPHYIEHCFYVTKMFILIATFDSNIVDWKMKVKGLPVALG